MFKRYTLLTGMRQVLVIHHNAFFSSVVQLPAFFFFFPLHKLLFVPTVNRDRGNVNPENEIDNGMLLEAILWTHLRCSNSLQHRVKCQALAGRFEKFVK